jgi:hypothetical protein
MPHLEFFSYLAYLPIRGRKIFTRTLFHDDLKPGGREHLEKAGD